jgi:hypothetical protein
LCPLSCRNFPRAGLCWYAGPLCRPPHYLFVMMCTCPPCVAGSESFDHTGVISRWSISLFFPSHSTSWRFQLMTGPFYRPKCPVDQIHRGWSWGDLSHRQQRRHGRLSGRTSVVYHGVLNCSNGTAHTPHTTHTHTYTHTHTKHTHTYRHIHTPHHQHTYCTGHKQHTRPHIHSLEPDICGRQGDMLRCLEA